MGSVYNFSNRLSSKRLLTKDQLVKTTRSADKISNPSSDDDDDIYSDLDWNDINFSFDDEEVTREEVYSDIYNTVELYPELKDAIEKFCDSAITPDSSGRYFSMDIDQSLDSYTKSTIQEAHDDVVALLGFDSHMEAWKSFYEWSMFGRVAYIIRFEFKTRTELNKEKDALRNRLGLVKINLKESAGDKKKSEALRLKEAEMKKTYTRISNLSEFESIKTDDEGNELIAVDIKRIDKVDFLEVAKAKMVNSGRPYYTYRTEILSENEVIIIDYNAISGNHLPIRNRGANTRPFKKVSYAHKLLRNYNILNRMEVTAVSWTILNAMYRQVTVVPIATKVSSKAKEALSKVRNKYLDNFTVDHDGKIRLNGETTYNTMKHIALADRGGAKPSVETVEWNGFDMSDMKTVSYFRNRFMDDSRLPYSRFDKEGQSGGLSIYKADGVPFTEVSFYNFLDRVLHQFSYAIKKPTRLLANIRDPKTTLIKSLDSKIRFSWESMNYYFEARRAEKETKILGDIDTYLRFADKNGDAIFPAKYLFVNKYKLFSEQEWIEIEQSKLVEEKDANDAVEDIDTTATDDLGLGEDTTATDDAVEDDF